MAGNREGGLKAAKTNEQRYPGFYKRIGHKGGISRSNENRGFARDPKYAREMGKRGAAVRLARALHSDTK